MKKILIGCILLLTACQEAALNTTVEANLPPTAIPTLDSATPTLPPTATTFPTPLYFTDEFDIVSPYWEIFQTGGTTAPLAAVENGSMRIAMDAADTWSIGIYNANTYSNVFVRAQASVTPTGSIGVVCRYDESSGWFEFNLGSDGTTSLLFGQWLTPGIAQYKPINTESAAQVSPAGQGNVVGLFCEDNFLHLYVNDTLILNVDVTNYGLTEGNIGITASSFAEAPMSASFEWVKVDSK